MEKIHDVVIVGRPGLWNGSAAHDAAKEALGNLVGEHAEGIEAVSADAVRSVEIEERPIGQVARKRDGRVCAQIVIGSDAVEPQKLFFAVGHLVANGIRARRRRGIGCRQGGDRSRIIPRIGIVGRNVIDQGIPEVGIAHGV